MSNILGERISDLMKKNGLNQKEKVKITEISMSRYIRGERTPKGTVIVDLANVLGTTPNYLLGQDDKETENDPELEYYSVQRMIARNASNWTAKQKADLVNAIFETK